MKFFHNRIINPAGNDNSSFEDYVNNLLKTADTEVQSENITTASEAKPENEDDPRGQGRGQVINNDNEEGAHSYQEGESVDGKPDQAEGKGGGKKDKDKEASTDQKVVEAKCGKEMGECADAGKVTEEHTDAGPGDDEHPEPKININNDPNYQKGESVDGGKVTGKNKKDKAASVKSKFQKVSSLNHKGTLQLFAVLSANKNNLMPSPNPLAYVEAMTGEKFANMQEDEKSWFRSFWRTMYPNEYVEEMVSDR